MNCRVALLITACMSLVITACVFDVDHEIEDQSDASFISIEGPGDEVTVDGDGFSIEYDVDCSLHECQRDLWCRISSADSGDADSFESCEFPLSVTEADVGEGHHTLDVELRTDEGTLDAATTETLVRFDFHIAIEKWGTDSEQSFSHPDLGPIAPTCTHSDCRLDACQWTDEHGDIADCSLESDVELTIPDTSAPDLLLRGCVDVEQSEHCTEQVYSLGYDDPSWNDIATGSGHTCGILDDDTLWCWGLNGDGQLGIESTGGAVDHPQRIDGFNWSAVSVGEGYTCAIDADGRLFCWGTIADLTDATSPQLVDLGPWASVSAGTSHACAIDTDEELYCWGHNSSGELGLRSHNPADEPTSVTIDGVDDARWLHISAGDVYTCGIAEDSDQSPRAYCWGRATDDRLGIDAAGDQDEPRPVAGPLETIEAQTIAAGAGRHSCAVGVEDSGQSGVYCWGRGAEGELGTGDSTDQPLPVPIDDSDNYIDVSTGERHSCALTEEPSTVHCWGSDNSLQLGSGEDLTSTETPTVVDEPDWATLEQVSSGADYNYVIDADGTLYGWGFNMGQQLGTGTGDEAPVASPTRQHWPYDHFADANR